MKFLFATSALLVSLAIAAPAEVVEKRATPTLYLVGDSTMAKGGGGTVTQGQPRPQCLIPLINIIRLGRLPPLLPQDDHRRQQRRHRRALRPFLHRRRALQYTRRQDPPRRLRGHRVRSQRRWIPHANRQRPL